MEMETWFWQVSIFLWAAQSSYAKATEDVDGLFTLLRLPDAKHYGKSHGFFGRRDIYTHC